MAIDRSSPDSSPGQRNSIVGSAASPLRQSVRINEFTPTAVGIGSGTGDSVGPLDPADFYVSVS
jgi:hypothetical protein